MSSTEEYLVNQFTEYPIFGIIILHMHKQRNGHLTGCDRCSLASLVPLVSVV